MMSKKIFAFLLVLSVLAGCSTCTLIRSEYYDITGKISEQKDADREILLFGENEKPDRPYRQIGVVKVMARMGTTKEAINEEMKRRARPAGADAVVDIQYGEDRTGDVIFCGKLLATKRNQAVSGKAVIFTDKK